MIKNDSTKVVTAHLPTKLVGQIDELAGRLERSKTWIIKEALSNWIALEQKRYILTLEAISEAEHGKVVSHRKIEEWVSSLGKIQ